LDRRTHLCSCQRADTGGSGRSTPQLNRYQNTQRKTKREFFMKGPTIIKKRVKAKDMGTIGDPVGENSRELPGVWKTTRKAGGPLPKRAGRGGPGLRLVQKKPKKKTVGQSLPDKANRSLKGIWKLPGKGGEKEKPWVLAIKGMKRKGPYSKKIGGPRSSVSRAQREISTFVSRRSGWSFVQGEGGRRLGIRKGKGGIKKVSSPREIMLGERKPFANVHGLRVNEERQQHGRSRCGGETKKAG